MFIHHIAKIFYVYIACNALVLRVINALQLCLRGKHCHLVGNGEIVIVLYIVTFFNVFLSQVHLTNIRLDFNLKKICYCKQLKILPPSPTVALRVPLAYREASSVSMRLLLGVM